MKHCGTLPLETERLRLRPFQLLDGPDMLRHWAADAAVQREYGEPTYPTAVDVARLLGQWVPQYANPAFYRWAIVERQSGTNIGQIAFCRVYEDVATAEIEYCIGQAFQGHGYAGEALAAVADATFRHAGFERLEAFHRAANERSGRVLAKSPLRRADTVRRFALEGKEPDGEVCYAITRREYVRESGNLEPRTDPSSSPLRVAPLTQDDLPACLKVLHAGFARVAAEFGLTAENCPTNAAFVTLERLQREWEQGVRFYGAWVDGQLVGCLQLADQGNGVWELQKLAVLPACRHHGVGRALVEFARGEASRLGATALTIGIIEENARLRRWYEELGFIHCGTRTYPHLPFTVGRMEVDCRSVPAADSCGHNTFGR